MMRIVKPLAGILGFTLIFFLIFLEIGDVLMHKQIEGRWNMTDKVAGFYNEEPGSIDLLFFGSSHMYCSVDPEILYEETGLTSYIFATQQQPLWITYHYMKEALKVQRPELMAVEVHMVAGGGDKEYMDEGTNHTAIDPIPMSKNKLEMIWASVPEGERRYYILDIMKYHDRWEELKMEDYVRSYESSKDPEKGYVRLDNVSDKVVWEDVSSVTESQILLQKKMDYISKIVDLAQAEGIPLLLFKSPSNATVEDKMVYNAVAELAADRGVEYIDFNSRDHYEKIGLDIKADFYDQMHLNEAGVSKFVPYFSSFLN
jgi:hypothetical protein